VPGLRELGGGGERTHEVDLLVRQNVPDYSPAVERIALPAGFARIETRPLQNWMLTRLRSATPVRIDHAELLIDPADSSRVSLVRDR
jgi:hypothetical protein